MVNVFTAVSMFLLKGILHKMIGLGSIAFCSIILMISVTEEQVQFHELHLHHRNLHVDCL